MGALMAPVSCVSCVSWGYQLNAAETYEMVHRESGMRYQLSTQSRNPCSETGYLAPGSHANAVPGLRRARFRASIGWKCTSSAHYRRADVHRPAPASASSDTLRYRIGRVPQRLKQRKIASKRSSTGVILATAVICLVPAGSTGCHRTNSERSIHVSPSRTAGDGSLPPPNEKSG